MYCSHRKFVIIIILYILNFAHIIHVCKTIINIKYFYVLSQINKQINIFYVQTNPIKHQIHLNHNCMHNVTQSTPNLKSFYIRLYYQSYLSKIIVIHVITHFYLDTINFTTNQIINYQTNS